MALLLAENLVDMVFQTIDRLPGKLAYSWREQGQYVGLTYAQFGQRVEQFALGLKSLGIGFDDKVALLSTNRIEWPIADIGIMSLGAVTCPIYPTSTPSQVEFILKNADVKIVVCEDLEQVGKVLQVWPETLQYAVVMEGNHPDARVLSFAEVERRGRANPDPGYRTFIRSIGRDDLATIVHTSGTTGNPKGVMLTHGNILSNVEAVHYTSEVFPSDHLLSFLPLSHIFERMAGQFVPLSVGATITFADSVDTVAEQLLEVKPTVLISVPRIYEKIYAKVQQQISSGSKLKQKIFRWAVEVGKERYQYMLENPGKPLPWKLEKRYRRADKLVFSKIKEKTGGRIRALVSGGASLAPEIAEFFVAMDLPVLEGYGMTETAPVITANPQHRSKIGTVGRPVPGVQVKLAEDGEILCKGPNVMKGYYKLPEETAKTIVDGWLHTGDIGQFDEEGYLRIVDRKKNILVLATGKNVAPLPIESAIILSPYIAQAVVIGDSRKYVAALVVPDYEQLEPWAKSNGVKDTGRDTLIRDPKVMQLLYHEVQKQVEHFAPFEQPKKIAILPNELTEANGELTPSLKVKVKVVLEKYKDVIEQMYSDDSSNVFVAGGGRSGFYGGPVIPSSAPAPQRGTIVTSIPQENTPPYVPPAGPAPSAGNVTGPVAGERRVPVIIGADGSRTPVNKDSGQEPQIAAMSYDALRGPTVVTGPGRSAGTQVATTVVSRADTKESSGGGAKAFVLAIVVGVVLGLIVRYVL
jgi:long-chain acyl-CoA synthetase